MTTYRWKGPLTTRDGKLLVPGGPAPYDPAYEALGYLEPLPGPIPDPEPLEPAPKPKSRKGDA